MNGIRIARIRGIDVVANWSVVVIAALIAWSLAEEVLPRASEGNTATQYWVAAGVAVFAFLGGLLAHELGHSIRAQREGVTVVGITLWLFGGVAQLGSSPRTPRAAFRIAAAGPAVSLTIGVLALVASVPVAGLAGATLAWLGIINLALAVFNLIPAFPLDGGRIYHAWRWQQTGDEVAATERAVGMGLLIGGILVGVGIVEALVGDPVGGLWLVLIGWFVREAARAELQHVLVDRPLADVAVEHVMTPDPTTVSADSSVAGFVAGALLSGRHASYPVVDAQGDVVGIIGLGNVQTIPRDDWKTTTTADVATPLADLVHVPPGTALPQLLSAMGQRAEHRALVVSDGKVRGIIAPSDVTRLVSFLEVAGRHATPPSPSNRPQSTQHSKDHP